MPGRTGAPKRTQRRRSASRGLISSHLGGIKRALLEGDFKAAFLAFLEDAQPTKNGIYALYDARERLYYAGRAVDLPRRLNQHLKDRHADGWETMTLFFVPRSADVGHLEGVIVAAARPPGNKRRPKIGKDLRRELRSYLRADATRKIGDAVYPERAQKEDTLARRITSKMLHSVPQSRLARALGISQPRVSQLLADGSMQRYIRESGKRDRVLNLLDRHGG